MRVLNAKITKDLSKEDELGKGLEEFTMYFDTAELKEEDVISYEADTKNHIYISENKGGGEYKCTLASLDPEDFLPPEELVKGSHYKVIAYKLFG